MVYKAYTFDKLYGLRCSGEEPLCLCCHKIKWASNILSFVTWHNKHRKRLAQRT